MQPTVAEEKQKKVIQYFLDNPNASMDMIAAATNISKSSCQRYLSMPEYSSILIPSALAYIWKKAYVFFNVLKTNEFIEHFISYGNYIQLATKQEIPQIIIDTILQYRKFEHQVSIYVSMPTMSAINQLEEGTASVNTRLENIRRCVISSIPVVLYVKPFIEGITDKDTDAFLNILWESNIPVIIGDFLSTSSTERIADVGEKKLYERPESIAYEEFIDCFSKKCQLYKHSTEIIEYYRDKRRNINDRRVD